MIWATVSSWSCFCWLYRASPSLSAKNIIILISVLAIWWCPCVESCLVLLEEGVCYDQCVLLAKLYLAFALLHSVLQGRICLLLQVFFDFLLLHFSPLQWKVCIKSLLTSDVSVRVWSEQSEWPGIIIMWIRPYAVAGAGGEDHGRLLHLVQCCCSLTWVLTIWWCPCVESSLVWLEESVCYDQCVFLAKLY